MNFFGLIIFILVTMNSINAKSFQQTTEEAPLSRSTRDEIGWNRLANNLLSSRRGEKKISKAFAKAIAKKVGVNKYAFLRSINRRMASRHF